ncbi:MAG TPA: hypothetical protein VHW23_44235, partial [Kofleriaceae bacterium]|nr:hypothetical protein [Kofleriaceae bacterium]
TAARAAAEKERDDARHRITELEQRLRDRAPDREREPAHPPSPSENTPGDHAPTAPPERTPSAAPATSPDRAPLTRPAAPADPDPSSRQ